MIRWVAGFILLAGLLATLAMLLREPTFEGKTIHSWLMEAAYARNYSTTKTAVEFFKRNNERAMPRLKDVIEGRSFGFMRWLKGHPLFLGHLPLWVQKRVNEKVEQEFQVRNTAINMCIIIGPSARSAEFALVQACSDPDSMIRGAAADALGSTRASPALAVPVLVQMLGDTNSGVRMNAAFALQRYGGEAQAAVPALNGMVKLADADEASLLRGVLFQIEHPEEAAMMHERSRRPRPPEAVSPLDQKPFSSSLSNASKLTLDGHF
jgi:hypothetical protein